MYLFPFTPKNTIMKILIFFSKVQITKAKNMDEITETQFWDQKADDSKEKIMELPRGWCTG